MPDFLRALRLIWERSSDIEALLDRLPEVLHSAGEGMETAGNWAVEVSQGLSAQGQGGPSNQPTLSGILDDLVSLTDSCSQKLLQTATQLGILASVLDQIQVPSISPVMHPLDLGFWSGEVMIGIDTDLASPPFVGPVVNKLTDVEQDLREVAASIRTASQGIDSIKDISDSAARHTRNIGSALEEGGDKLKTAFPN